MHVEDREDVDADAQRPAPAAAAEPPPEDASRRGRRREARERKQVRTWWLIARLQRPTPEVQASWRNARRILRGMRGESPRDNVTAKQCEVLESRWIDQTLMYERLWRSQRGVYYLVRVPIILGATTIPVLASLHVPAGWTVGVGLTVAVLTALDSFFQLGARWQLHRHAATELGFEGWEFISLVGRYAKKTRASAARDFIAELEVMNKKLALAYLAVFREERKQADKRP
jgi:hypothetical protein